MSDNSFFEAPADEPVQSRKSLLVLGAVGGALVLAAGGYFLLGGGGGTSDVQSFAVVPRRVAPVVKVSKPAVKKLVTIPAVSKVRLGRDPFLALYVPPVAAPASSGTTAPTAPTSTTTTVVTPGKTTTTTTGTPPRTTGTTPTTTGGTAPAPAPVAPPASTKHRFTIFGITGSASTGRARVSIDGGAPFTVHEGSIFGPNKELTITDIGLTVGVGEHVAFTIGEDPQPEMYAHESRLVP